MSRPPRDDLLGVATAAFLLAATPADAALTQLSVTYTDPEVVSGPLSFGLSALPSSVTSRFVFDDDDVAFDPDIGAGDIALEDIRSARVEFGDGVWTTLTAFSSSYAIVEGAPVFFTLSYSFGPIDTLTAASGIIPNSNFVLHPSGIDVATGDRFEYRYNTSSQTLAPAPRTAVPEPAVWSILLTGFAGAGAMIRLKSGRSRRA